MFSHKNKPHKGRNLLCLVYFYRPSIVPHLEQMLPKHFLSELKGSMMEGGESGEFQFHKTKKFCCTNMRIVNMTELHSYKYALTNGYLVNVFITMRK